MFLAQVSLSRCHPLPSFAITFYAISMLHDAVTLARRLRGGQAGRLLNSIARSHAAKLIRIKGSRALSLSLCARFCRQDEKGVSECEKKAKVMNHFFFFTRGLLQACREQPK